MSEEIVIEKAYKLKIIDHGDDVFRYVELCDLQDDQLRRLYNDTKAMNDFPSLLEAVTNEREKRAAMERMRANADWVAKQVFELMEKRGVTLPDILAAIDRLAATSNAPNVTLTV
jgi:hypothetical protein